MSDEVPALAFVALCAAIAAWILTYRGIVRTLRLRQPERSAAIFGAAGQRKNGMDRFFAIAGLLFRNDPVIRGDPSLRRRFGVLKFCSILIVACFVTMMFSPLFLRLPVR